MSGLLWSLLVAFRSAVRGVDFCVGSNLCPEFKNLSGTDAPAIRMREGLAG